MSGKVYLVGAGPGDEGLLTIRGKAVLEMADVVVYDRLVSPAILALARKKSEKIYVGKEAANHSMAQEDINQLLVDKAKAGHTVVRLKGGDSFVFGRGGEECEKLHAEGIYFEVVPGITSAIGGLAYAGIPITHRDMTSSFHVFTGHFKDEEREHDWSNIARLKGTKVFLMGVGNLEYIIEKMLENGTVPEMPVAIISNATKSSQKVLVSTVSEVVEATRKMNIKPPSLLVIGDVVNLRESMNWFESRPLFGQQVVVTRARAQSTQLSGKLRELGAKVIELPAIKIQPRPIEQFQGELENLKAYKWLIFTSENGVDIFMEGLFASGKDARALNGIKIAVIGNGTEKMLLQYGIKADLKPKRAVAEGLIEAFTGKIHDNDKVLFPRASEARDVLLKWLETRCDVKELLLYDTVMNTALEPDVLESVKDADWITFASASAVKYFFKQMEMAGHVLSPKTKVASIGPITSGALVFKRYTPDVEAKTHDVNGLIQALIDGPTEDPELGEI